MQNRINVICDKLCTLLVSDVTLYLSFFCVQYVYLLTLDIYKTVYSCAFAVLLLYAMTQ